MDPEQTPANRPRIEIFDFPEFDLHVLSAPDVLNLYRILRRDDDAFFHGERTPALGDRVNLLSGLGRTIAELPQLDLGFARDVYTAFATSPLAEDRRSGAHYLGYLTRTDHDYGLSLWDQLVRDPDADVRDSAIRGVLYYRQAIKARNQRRIAEQRNETGLTSREAAR